VYFNSALSKKLLGNNYGMIFRELNKMEIIETRDTGQRYMGYPVYKYRLSEYYRGQEMQWLDLEDIKLKRKIKSYYDTHTAHLQWLKKSLNSLTIDKIGATLFINCRYTKGTEQYRRRELAIEMIANNPLAILTDNNSSGRVFTSYSCIPRDIRTFCRVNGKPLESMDLSCSQLYHFLPMVNEYVKHHGLETENIYGEGINYNDVEFFTEIVCGTQDSYSFFMSNSGYEGCRNDFKDTFFSNVWYCSNHKTVISPIRQYFDATFPTITKALDFSKSNIFQPYEEPQDRFKNFPIYLQAIERLNVVDNLTRGLIRDYPNSTFIPVHDGIDFSNGMKDITLERTSNLYKTKYGLLPRIK
jgi:hypothetical protein